MNSRTPPRQTGTRQDALHVSWSPRVTAGPDGVPHRRIAVAEQLSRRIIPDLEPRAQAWRHGPRCKASPSDGHGRGLEVAACAYLADRPPKWRSFMRQNAGVRHDANMIAMAGAICHRCRMKPRIHEHAVRHHRSSPRVAVVTDAASCNTTAAQHRRPRVPARSRQPPRQSTYEQLPKKAPCRLARAVRQDARCQSRSPQERLKKFPAFNNKAGKPGRFHQRRR